MYLHLVIGPMYSGKTSELIRLAERYRIAEKKVLVVKYGEDNRYTQDEARNEGSVPGSERSSVPSVPSDHSVATHDGKFLEAVDAMMLSEIVERGFLANHDVICVDEVQFYPDSDLLVEWADSGKIIVASGLSGNYLREQFKGMPYLIANADCIEHLNSVCMQCKKDGAAFSALLAPQSREGNSEHSENSESERALKATTKLIGGQETYLALCRECYVKHKPLIA